MEVNKVIEKENEHYILTQDGKELIYLESKSTRRPAECTIYANIFNQFLDKAYYLETHLNHITMDKLKEIINNYYSIFQENHNISAFGINQETYSWFGYGPLNFIKALEMQDIRYAELFKNKDYIHHREAACFIDELSDTIFYIHLQPNRKDIQSEQVTLDYVNIGFVFHNIPYHKKYYNFFEKIGSVPEFIDEINNNLTKSKQLEYTFKEEGYVVDKKFGGWVRGAFTKNFKNNNITNIYNDKIVVNFNQEHEINNRCKYSLYGVTTTTLPAGNFPAIIVNYKGDWEII
jgi:hypothetical protein